MYPLSLFVLTPIAFSEFAPPITLAHWKLIFVSILNNKISRPDKDSGVTPAVWVTLFALVFNP